MKKIVLYLNMLLIILNVQKDYLLYNWNWIGWTCTSYESILILFFFLLVNIYHWCQDIVSTCWFICNPTEFVLHFILFYWASVSDFGYQVYSLCFFSLNIFYLPIKQTKWIKHWENILINSLLLFHGFYLHEIFYTINFCLFNKLHKFHLSSKSNCIK
jgi:hypothetical protein